MSIQNLVIQSQLVPPSLRKGVLIRPRLAERLNAVYDYPLTIVQAGTGHSKTTTLSAFAQSSDPLFWYTITEPDRDPLLFLAHLLSAFNRDEYCLGETALAALEESGGRVTASALIPLLNALTIGLPGPAVLVLDDFHLVGEVPEIAALIERLVDYHPPQLHIVISTRQMPALPALNRWRVKNQVLELLRSDLTFTAPEIDQLFREQYHLPLSPPEVQALAEETEGWAIALQMIWQNLRSGAAASLNEVLGRLPETLEGLFDYLAQEVLAQQPAHLQRFLLTTSVLRELTAPVCDALMEVTGSEQTLNQLHERGLFLSTVGAGVYRYQHLFRDFLYARLSSNPAEAHRLHSAAADFYLADERPEETIYHLLEAGEFQRAAGLIEQIGPGLIHQGRLNSLTGWIESLPAVVLEQTPGLYLLRGDVQRLRSHFDAALESFAEAARLFIAIDHPAGQSRALRGQAQVYLDTIRPIKADSLLEAALRLLDPNLNRQETADLLEQIAENHLNMGHPDQAQSYYREARSLRSADSVSNGFLMARAMLRTGQLDEARRQLDNRAEQERQNDPARPQRFHRETLALLSLIASLQGDADAAERSAREGLQTARRLESAFVEAVAYMRLGHALLLHGLRPWQTLARENALACYQRAIDIVQPFHVARVKVEPLWGICRAYSCFGQVAAGENYAHQALEAARQAGDEWISNLVRVSMGAGYVLARRNSEAESWLREARAGFINVGDTFGQAAALLWLSLNTSGVEQLQHLAGLLDLVEEHGYTYLLTRPTHLGLKDEQAAIPLLITARQHGLHAALCQRMLHELGAEGLDYHPGYTLHVRTLGAFEVWRGDTLIRPPEWQREKARQIFQLLITEPGRWLTREQIADQLWPDLDPDSATRDFKAALNALQRAIEPDRPAGTQPFFIIRRESLYGINPRARVVLDSADFEASAAAVDPDLLRAALSMYQQDYLCAEQGDWLVHTRERLRQTYLNAASRLADTLFRQRDFDQTIQVCQKILSHDRTWEEAYRLLMRVYASLGNRPQLLNVYNRCAAALQEELDVLPSPETEEILRKTAGPPGS